MAKFYLNTTVFVTGASSGFGEATARLFAKEGARLVLIARRAERLKSLAAELKKSYGTESQIVALDVSNFDKAKKAFDALKEPFLIPDILVNNAGLVRGMAKLWEVTPDEWNEMIDVNVKGVLNITRILLPKMVDVNRGHIINVGSTSGYGTYPGGGVYCATKFALRALTDTLRMELVATPIRVSLVSPGMAKTEFSEVRFNGDKEKSEKIYEGIDALTANDIAEAILFMASRPPHVNIADMIIYPTNQASPNHIHRR